VRCYKRRPDKRVTRHPAIGAARCLGGRGSVGRIRHSRHPAMGFSYGIGGMIPFTIHTAGFFYHRCGERDKGSGRAPLVNPRGPARKSVLRTALTSRVPDCGRLDSACSPLRDSLHASIRLCPPSMASRPCHSRFDSPISAGTYPHRCDIAEESHFGVADTLPDGANAYPAYGIGAFW